LPATFQFSPATSKSIDTPATWIISSPAAVALLYHVM
jgi:hypothetical protein